MKVESKYVIDGNVVEFKTEFAGIKVYEASVHDNVNLYFVKNDEVIQTLKIEADCGQNVGYISECEFISGFVK